jgi:hypothetical protein
MHKILIISYNAESFHLERTRTVQISNALHNLGNYTIDYITCDGSTLPDYVNKIYYLKRSKLRKRLDSIYIKLSSPIRLNHLFDKPSLNLSGGFSPILSETKILRFTYDFFFDYIIEPLLNHSLKLKDYDYDLVFSSFHPWTNHTVAKNIIKKIKKNRESFWVQDYRDPVIQSLTPVFIRPILSYMLIKMSMKCDLITYCAPFENKQLGFYEATPSYMLENGFDNFISHPLSSNEMREFALDNEKLKLIFAGSLYPGRSDLSPVFDAIKLLVAQNKLLSNRVNFYYFGKTKAYFDKKYKGNELFDILSFDKINREQILSIYNHMDIFVAAAWSFEDFILEGDPSSKVYELLRLDKPLIGIVKKDQGTNNSYMSKLFSRHDKAFCFEISNKAEHEAAVLEIMNLILSVEANRNISSNLNLYNNDFGDMSWLEITRRFIKHLELFQILGEEKV